MRLHKGMMGKNGWVKRTNRKCRRESRSRKIKNGGGEEGTDWMLGVCRCGACSW